MVHKAFKDNMVFKALKNNGLDDFTVLMVLFGFTFGPVIWFVSKNFAVQTNLLFLSLIAAYWVGVVLWRKHKGQLLLRESDQTVCIFTGSFIGQTVSVLMCWMLAGAMSPWVLSLVGAVMLVKWLWG